MQRIYWELSCVCSLPLLPKKKMSTFQNVNIHFFSLGLTITATFIFLLPEEGEISYERGCVAEKHLTSLPYIYTYSLGDSRCSEEETQLICHDNLHASLQIMVWCDQEKKFPCCGFKFEINIFEMIIMDILNDSVHQLRKGTGINSSPKT